ncbi:MAG: acetyl-CoA carboxylase biotin carboxyl carrier protein [Chlamydiae bacterium]|nr:acetyl-CoA carboxylase biotin carboxyl carrier protein [Chlamydiota bacterium]
MDAKQIKELMAAMARIGIDKMLWKQEGDFEISLERHPESHPHITHYNHPQATFMSPPSFEQDYQRPLPPARGIEEIKPANEEPGFFVTSPMVGTFYGSPSPEDPQFIKVGDVINANTVVCIIEAMKVMNEIRTSVVGTVAEVMVSNGSPVDFGAKLFRVV